MQDRAADGPEAGPPGRADRLLTGRATAGFSARLDAWVADARTDEAARQRARERWLRTAAEEEATLAGVLTELAERAAGVALSTTAGRRHRGSVGALGADFLALRPASGPEVLVALGAVSVVRTLPAEDPALGDHAVRSDLTIADVLGELAAERERVLLVTRAGGDSIAGELRSVGRDVVVLRTDAGPQATAYLPLAAIAEVTLG